MTKMTERFASLPDGTRRWVLGVWAFTFIAFLFGVVPAWLGELNQELGWPGWETTAGRVAGIATFVASLALLIYCSRLFSSVGKGTPVPIAPPSELVVSGIYRYSRNPIYVGQVGILFSYFLYTGALALLLYAIFWLLMVQGFIVRVEEPDLRARFGPAYAAYADSVPRWLGVPRRGAGQSP